MLCDDPGRDGYGHCSVEKLPEPDRTATPTGWQTAPQSPELLASRGLCQQGALGLAMGVAPTGPLEREAPGPGPAFYLECQCSLTRLPRTGWMTPTACPPCGPRSTPSPRQAPCLHCTHRPCTSTSPGSATPPSCPTPPWPHCTRSGCPASVPRGEPRPGPAPSVPPASMAEPRRAQLEPCLATSWLGVLLRHSRPQSAPL